MISCKASGVRRVPQERALPPHLDQILVLELVEMMGKRGGGDFQLFLDVADHQSLRDGRSAAVA